MKVIRRQPNSKMCLVCGVENESGLKAPFYEMEDNTVVSIFEYKEIHQSYPNRTHGGMISCVLDEIIGRAIWIYEPRTWGVTMELKVKFRKPVLYNTIVKTIGKVTKNSSRTFIGEGMMYDLEGNLLASAEATYFKLPFSKLAIDKEHEDINIYLDNDRSDIE